MSQIMKAFLGLFLILAMAGLELGILSAFLTVMHAQELHADILCRMENSNMNEEVLRSCFTDAEENNCRMWVTLYRDDHSLASCSEASGLPANTDDISMAQVVLEVPIEIPLVGVRSCFTLKGYAY